MEFALEIRQVNGLRVLYGRMPYGTLTTIADRGRVRKERFSPRAFAFAIENEVDRAGAQIKIDLLVGHDWGKPIASRQSGTLAIRHDDNAVEFEATLPATLDDTPSWVVDAEKAIAGGTMTGLSPGFRVPPANVVSNAEILIPEPGNPGVAIRQVNHAMLRELSVVTNAQYADAFVELRSEVAGGTSAPRAGMLWL